MVTMFLSPHGPNTVKRLAVWHSSMMFEWKMWSLECSEGFYFQTFWPSFWPKITHVWNETRSHQDKHFDLWDEHKVFLFGTWNHLFLTPNDLKVAFIKTNIHEQCHDDRMEYVTSLIVTRFSFYFLTCRPSFLSKDNWYIKEVQKSYR